MVCSYQLIRTKGSLSSLGHSQRTQPCPHLDFGLLAPRTVRHTSVVVSQPPHGLHCDQLGQRPLYAHTWV